ncbi:MAG: peroxide stress protein YaaA, partial [Acidimicrobiia bacterium]|nr:peroxide stress protein YaaA [Acidimicrobiia bacterium]
MASGRPSRAKLLGVKGEALAAATEIDRHILDGPTRPAIERYAGVLYAALGYGDMATGLRRRFDRQTMIFSGLWGVVAPRDPIPDYKLKMGAALIGTGRLAAYWRELLTAGLAPVVDRRVVWDLLPNEHAAAWRPGQLTPRRRVTVRFLDDVVRNGRRQLVVVSHWNKWLKGALVRHVVEHQLVDPDGLAGFEHPEGYRYRSDLSTADDDVTQAVFVARR